MHGCSSFIYFKSIGLRGNEKGTTAKIRSDWFRFQRSPPASTPDAKADDCTGDNKTKKNSNVLKLL